MYILDKICKVNSRDLENNIIVMYIKLFEICKRYKNPNKKPMLKEDIILFSKI